GRHGHGVQPAGQAARRRGQDPVRRRGDADEHRHRRDARRRGLPDGVQEAGERGRGQDVPRPLLPARDDHAVDSRGRLSPGDQVRSRADAGRPGAQAVPRGLAEREARPHHRSRMGQGEARRAADHRARRAARRKSQASPRSAPAERRRRGRSLTVGGPRRARRATGWQALLWLGPSLALIGGVVLYPAAQLVRASLSQFSVTGLSEGFVGLRNYTRLFRQEPLAIVVANTVVWVAVVVAVTIFLSLALAQLLGARFPGRTLVRWALIVPWAASVIMTSQLFAWVYDCYFGVLNPALQALGILSHPVDWLG